MDQQEEESCRVPPGFRFHPTEEELVGYYLARKVASQKIDLDIIQEVDLYRIEPWDLQERCSSWQQHAGGERQPTEWYLFSYKDRKYPSGTRTNRATAAGFWKATGRDKPVVSSSRVVIGMRKTLVFYRGRAPNGSKTDWIMHEYRLVTIQPQQAAADGCGWVVCRAFQKPIPNNQRPPPFCFFPSNVNAAAAGYYDYDHHLSTARLPLDGRFLSSSPLLHHHQFLSSSSPPILAAAGNINSLLFVPDDDDDDLLVLQESKTKHLFNNSIPQLESPTASNGGIACDDAAPLERIISSSSYDDERHDADELIIQAAEGGAAAGGVIDWNFLDTFLSTTSQLLHEPSPRSSDSTNLLQ